MRTWTALTTVEGRVLAEALGEAMERLVPSPVGLGVFEVEDGGGLWEVGGHFVAAPAPADLALLSAAFGAAEFAVSEVPEVDWVAHVRRELAPVEDGRFFVHGSHDSGKAPEGRIALLIEASMAFGTGHHGTTLGCLRALDGLAEGGFEAGNVIDVGCGTAVLAMAAAHLWDVKALATDIDAVAVEVAEANVAANGLGGRVSCVGAAGFDHPRIAAGAPYDLVLANILMGPLVDLAKPMAAHTAAGAAAILSGVLTTQADDLAAAYSDAGFGLSRREDIGEWSTLVLTRT